MIRLAMVAVPATDERLAAIRQVGVEHLVHYDMSNDAAKFDRLEAEIARARHFGLAVPVVESGPPIARIVAGAEGADREVDLWIETIARLGRLGVEVICYNFMPQVLDDAMVVRTNFNAATRGGACTTAFRLADLSRRHLDFGGGIPLPLEAVQENLRRFLIAVVPAAEAAGVKLAMHPDDPPLSPIAGFARIMSSVDSFDWLLELHSSPMNGLTLCAGCFGELGVSVPQLVRRFGSRIHFVHLRNIRGSLVDFIETFPDDGDVDLVGTLAALDGIGFDGYARPDHAPLLGTEAPEVAAGYGFEGHLFTVGYLRGVLAGLERGRAA